MYRYTIFYNTKISKMDIGAGMPIGSPSRAYWVQLYLRAQHGFYLAKERRPDKDSQGDSTYHTSHRLVTALSLGHELVTYPDSGTDAQPPI